MVIEEFKKKVVEICADGIVTNEEMQFLRSKAKELQLSETDLEFLLKNALENTTKQRDDDTGFIETQTPEDTPSGFVTRPEAIQFTDVSLLPNQGAMSIMQKARYQDRWVVVKRLKPEHRNNPAYQRLFNREYQNISDLNHPHILHTYGRGTDAEGDFYYMEYIDAEPLSAYIEKNGVADGQFILKIVREMAEALEYVHKHQIVHRDIKPGNILITYQGKNVKIVDFGLAAAADFDEFIEKAGTMRYAAPEQLENNTPIDQRADIYSFGKVIQEMLTGNTDDIAPARERSFVLSEIIEKATKSKRDERFSNVAEITQLLQYADIDSFRPELNVREETVNLKKIRVNEPGKHVIKLENTGQGALYCKVGKQGKHCKATIENNHLHLTFDTSQPRQIDETITVESNGGDEAITVKAVVIDNEHEKRKRNLWIAIAVSFVLLAVASYVLIDNVIANKKEFWQKETMLLQGQFNGKEKRVEVKNRQQISSTKVQYIYSLMASPSVYQNQRLIINIKTESVEFEVIGKGTFSKEGNIILFRSLPENEDTWEFKTIP